MSQPKFKDERIGVYLASVYLQCGKVDAIRLLRDHFKPGISITEGKATIEHYIPDVDAAETIIREFKENRVAAKTPTTIIEL